VIEGRVRLDGEGGENAVPPKRDGGGQLVATSLYDGRYGGKTVAVVLLVEDDANQRLLYEHKLAEDGHEVIPAASGGEALDAIEGSMPDVVVMDISMPGMDGIDAMSRMLGKNHRLPIILNTAYPSYQDDFRAWSADACVVKSPDMTDLRDAIAKVLAAR